MPVASFSAWQRWVRWGSVLPPITDLQSNTAHSSAADWTPVRRVAAAFLSFAEYEKLHLYRLLHQSDQCLAPLSDPLRFSFWKHRWLDLRGEREESYSDWLAWLLEEMGSAETPLKVFGLEDTEFGAQVRGAPPRVNREEAIRADGGEKKPAVSSLSSRTPKACVQRTGRATVVTVRIL